MPATLHHHPSPTTIGPVGANRRLTSTRTFLMPTRRVTSARAPTANEHRSHRRSRPTRGTFMLLAASLLAGLVLLAPAQASAAMPDCNAVDFQQACSFSSHDDFTDTVLCDFPVEVHATGHTRYRPFFATDRSGNLASETFHASSQATIVNAATGRFFTDGGDINRHRTFLPDGTVKLRETGLFHNARTDDGQQLFHQSGEHLALLDPDDNVINEVFHGNFESEAAFPGKVCPILAQPA
jgi:hypothetical protein